MDQNKYQPISTIKISAKGKFYWVKCPTLTDPNRSCLLQSYSTKLAAQLLESVQSQIDRLLPLTHPHLQSVIDVVATENSLDIVQELEEWDCAINQIPYTPAQARNLLQELRPLLSYLHGKDITHGNISPEAIVVNQDNKNILTNFLAIVDLITAVGGDTHPRLRSQLEKIPVVNLPTGKEWDLYSLGVTTIALLTGKDYQHLYDLDSEKWNWTRFVDCSEELIEEIDLLLTQKKQPQNMIISALEAPISSRDRRENNLQVIESARINDINKNPDPYWKVASLIMLAIVGLAGYFAWNKFYNSPIEFRSTITRDQPFSQNKTLTIGYISRTLSRAQIQTRDYPQFRSYLETELRKKYGNSLKVQLESVATIRDAQNSIRQKKWDIAFAFSATNSLIAEDNQYEFIARMFANEDPYRDVCFFVNQDSKIQSSKDFSSEQTIALPSEDSSIFVMPLYDLYGKRMRVSLGNSLSKIQAKVKSGEADVGVDFCNVTRLNSTFRTLSPNRIIPVGGVFLSPRIESIADRNHIKEVISKAPIDIQAKANYIMSSGVNYDRFRRINNRANELLACVDFTRNPVDFYCNNKLK